MRLCNVRWSALWPNTYIHIYRETWSPFAHWSGMHYAVTRSLLKVAQDDVQCTSPTFLELNAQVSHKVGNLLENGGEELSDPPFVFKKIMLLKIYGHFASFKNRSLWIVSNDPHFRSCGNVVQGQKLLAGKTAQDVLGRFWDRLFVLSYLRAAWRGQMCTRQRMCILLSVWM